MHLSDHGFAVKVTRRPMPQEGSRYGRLTVLGKCDAPEYVFAPKARRISWMMCLCDCGKRKAIQANSLKQGHAVSCGCRLKERRETHRDMHSGIRAIRPRDRAKLTPEQKLAIRSRRDAGESVAALAAVYHVSASTIRSALVYAPKDFSDSL